MFLWLAPFLSFSVLWLTPVSGFLWLKPVSGLTSLRASSFQCLAPFLSFSTNDCLTSLRASPFRFKVQRSKSLFHHLYFHITRTLQNISQNKDTYFKNHYICAIIDISSLTAEYAQEQQTTKRGYDYESKTSRGNNQVFLLE